MKTKILVMNVNWLGDVLFSTPALRAIKERYPQSYLACLQHPRTVAMLKDCKYVDELIVYDEEGKHKNLIGKLKLICKLRSKRFNAVFILHRSFTRALLAYLSGIPERVGYRTKGRGALLTKKIPPPTEMMHRVDSFLNLLKAVGIGVKDRAYEFGIAGRERDFISRFLEDSAVKEDDILIGINPGGNWNLKRWPAERFAELADALAKKYNAKIIITGAAGDIRLAEEIKKMMKATPIIAAGTTTLPQLAALLEKMRLFIAADTGPMHIAVSMKTNTIALFGPTSRQMTGPIGKGRYIVIQKDIGCDVPCYELSCPDNRCMKAITVEDVLNEAEKLI